MSQADARPVSLASECSDGRASISRADLGPGACGAAYHEIGKDGIGERDWQDALPSGDHGADVAGEGLEGDVSDQVLAERLLFLNEAGLRGQALTQTAIEDLAQALPPNRIPALHARIRLLQDKWGWN